MKLNSSPSRFGPLSVLLAVSLIGFVRPAAAAERWSDYVRPLVGTAGEEGNTFPGPSAPFGMMQLGPDTDTCRTNWNTCSGYSYDDPTILGFSLTHLSGTGCPDLGDFLFVPQVGRPAHVPGDVDHPETGYQSTYSHAEESVSAAYYKVKLLKSGVTVDMTTGERAGIMRFTFPASNEASIMTDLSHIIGPCHIAESRIRIENNSTVTGFHLVNGWAKERYIYFAARYSRPFDDTEIISSGKPVIYNTYRFRSHKEASGTNVQFLAKYTQTHAGEVIQVKVAISAISAADAMQNLDAEIPGWNFKK
jgi:putative alpha-1,2-mannosidase